MKRDVRTRTKRKASALKALYAANPEMFGEFIQSLAESVGLPAAGQELSTFTCPSCGSGFSISAKSSSTPRVRQATRTRRGGSVNPLLVKLAKKKGVMVGDVHNEFSKHLGSQVKGMNKDAIRQKKIEWMKAELSRLEKKRRAAAA